MNWIEELHRTYENCEAEIGKQKKSQDDKKVSTPLLPICHTTQQAQIKIVIDDMGQFRRAQVIPKDESTTITPCTEASAGRAGIKPIQHPLFDKLQYVAGDFVEFGGEVTVGYAKDPKVPHEQYMQDLSAWCASPYRHPKVIAVLNYLKKGRVIRDLVEQKILHVGNDGKLLFQWNQGSDEDSPPVFKLLSGKVNAKGERQPWQADAFVKFAVECPNDPQVDLDSDPTIWKSWGDYYASTKSAKDLCFISGQEDFLADQHPAKIRNSGDKAKLISSNDISGFTFRGRFFSDSEACGIGFKVTQKAHSALRWLIDRQGWRNGDLAFVAWAVSGKDIPDPMADSWDLSHADEEENKSETTEKKSNTAQDIGNKLSRLLDGYSAKLERTEEIVFMGLNSATPGRMAILYYRELTASDFLARIRTWHRECQWLQRFSKDKIFIGTPAPKDIAKAAFGNDADTKLLNATVERIIPCIVDGAVFPEDLVISARHRACKRQTLEDWEWEKTLGIACSLFRYNAFKKNKEVFTMALDHERKTRDYLYGRLLAVADCLEGFALSDAEKNRPTNAARLMQRFADYPFSTWRTIELAISSYKERLGKQGIKYHKALQEVMDLFDPEEFKQDSPLSGEFLLGFHTQRTELYKSSKNDNDNHEEKQSEEA